MRILKKANYGVKVKKAQEGATVDPSDFEKAFAAARKTGEETFMFNGKSYNTKLKGEGESTKYNEGKKPYTENGITYTWDEEAGVWRGNLKGNEGVGKFRGPKSMYGSKIKAVKKKK